MAFYSYIFSANYKRYLKNLKEIAKKENKNYLKLILDTGYCVFRYGFCLSDYLNYKLYNKTKNERLQYVSTKTENKFYETVSPSAYKQRYTVKPRFLEEFKKYTKRDFIVPKEGEFEKFNVF